MQFIHWFVRWATLYPHWCISTLGGLAVAAFIWLRGCRDRICMIQLCAAVLGIYTVAVGYSKCTPVFYHYTNMAVDVLCSIMELVLAREAVRRYFLAADPYPPLGLMAAIVIHQNCKMFWYWSAALFDLPDVGYEENMRFASNLATMIAVVIMVYCEDGHLPLRTIHEQEEVHRRT